LGFGAISNETTRVAPRSTNISTSRCEEDR